MTKEARIKINKLSGRWTLSDKFLLAIIIIAGILLMAGWYYGFIALVPTYHAEYQATL